jgi:hypothetical protein
MVALRTFRAAPLALALILGLYGAASAQSADYSSHSEVDPANGSSVVNDGSNASSATLDANNYARSFITPGTSTMGAIVATDGSASPTTMTTHQDSWWFNCAPPNTCSSLPVEKPIPLSLTFGIKVSETQVTDSAYLEFDANYQLPNGGQFNFYFDQDGRGDFELNSNYITSTGDFVDLPVEKTLANGVWTLSVTDTVQEQICGLGASVCIPLEMTCPSGQTCSSPPAFTDFQSIKALIDPGQGETDIIDGYDPFSINVVSLDPNYQFVSADGRTITAGAAPEAATWAMLILGLAMVGLAIRRRDAAVALAA